nr:6312_t:CDS:2 [Entrophospora candida]
MNPSLLIIIKLLEKNAAELKDIEELLFEILKQIYSDDENDEYQEGAMAYVVLRNFATYDLDNNVIIICLITKADHRTNWKLNGEKSTFENIQSTVGSFNIKVDNKDLSN